MARVAIEFCYNVYQYSTTFYEYFIGARLDASFLSFSKNSQNTVCCGDVKGALRLLQNVNEFIF